MTRRDDLVRLTDALIKSADISNRVLHLDLRHMIEFGDDYNQAVKDAADAAATAIDLLNNHAQALIAQEDAQKGDGE
jgi:hypothetical protein